MDDVSKLRQKQKTQGWRRAKEAAGAAVNYRAFEPTWGRGEKNKREYKESQSNKKQKLTDR